MDLSGIIRVAPQSVKTDSSVDVRHSRQGLADSIKALRQAQPETNTLPSGDQQVSLSPHTFKVEAVEAEVQKASRYQAREGTVTYRADPEKDTYTRSELLTAELRNQAETERFSASALMGNLWDLDLSQGSYYDAARHYSGYSKVDEQGQVAELNYSDLGRKQQVTASFSLDIETKDGDKVTIQIDQEKGFANTFNFTGSSFSFKVDGSLDDEELEAIQALAMELSGSTDAFFNGRGTAKLGGLNSFDRSELSGFDLSVSSDKQSSSAEFSFRVDEHSGNQTLSAQQAGMKYEYTVDTDNRLVSSDYLHNAQMQNYLSLIESTANAYQLDGVSKREASAFLTDGFLSAMNIGQPGEAPSEAVKPGGERKDTDAPQHNSVQPIDAMNPQQLETAKSLVSGLPDFEASIFGTNDITPNPENPAERSFMSLEMQQKTHQQGSYGRDGELMKVTQSSSYEKDIRQHKPLDHLTMVDFKDQNYRYETLKEEGSLERSFTMDVLGNVTSGRVAHSESKEQTTKTYEMGELVDEQQKASAAAEVMVTASQDALKSDVVNRQLGTYSLVGKLMDDK